MTSRQTTRSAIHGNAFPLHMPSFLIAIAATQKLVNDAWIMLSPATAATSSQVGLAREPRARLPGTVAASSA